MKKHHAIFFGWFIVAAAVIMQAYQSTLFIYGFSVFMPFMAASTGWTVTQLSLATSLRGLETGALDPFTGFLVNRWSARKLLFTGVAIFTGSIFLIANVHSIGILYLAFILCGIGTSLCFTVVPITVVARWFKKGIGKANGLIAIGLAIGGIFAPFIAMGIEAWGWRNMLQYLGIGFLVISVPLTLLFRNSPEEYGLQPDGVQSKPDTQDAPVKTTSLTLKQALKTRAFWCYGFAMFFQIITVHATTVHIINYLTSDLGMITTTAAVSVTVISMVGIGFRFLYGVASDKFGAKYTYVFSLSVHTVAMLLLGLQNGSSFSLLMIFAVVYSLGVSATYTLRAPITRGYFGIKHFGAIYGILSIFQVGAGMIGAPLAGWVFDSTGSYFPIWYVFAGLNIIGLLLMLTMPKMHGYRELHGGTEDDIKQQLNIGK